MRSRSWMAQAVLALTFTTAVAAQSIRPSVISDIDLSKPFSTREAWQFTATQGPSVAGLYDEKEAGEIQLCLRMSPSASCDPQLLNEPGFTISANDRFTQPHYLKAVKIVYPQGAARQPLLFVKTGSLHSGNGGQTVLTQVLAYKNPQNRFVRIYQHVAGTNNNEEVRYIGSGRLKGDIISVEPTENAPYGYWVTVNALTPQYTYKTVLHYRSATHYGDRNPLAVIDSEMPNTQRRLGYWKPGMPLPLPPRGCPNPRLVHMELWCN